MAHLTRQKVTIAIPKKARVSTKSGIKYATWTGRDGSKMKAKVSTDGKRCTVVMKEWYMEYRDDAGKVQRIKLYASRKRSQERMGELLKQMGNGNAQGDQGPQELAPLVVDYQGYLESKDCKARHIVAAINRLRRIISDVGFKTTGCFDAHRLERHLAARRSDKDKPISCQTSNHYVKVLRAFCNYLMKRRKILTINQFDDIPLFNAHNHRTYERQPFTKTELWQLIDHTRKHGKVRRNLLGKERAMLYMVAAYTGFRLTELSHLTSDCFRLDGDSPVVVLKGRYTKNGKDAIQPIPATIAAKVAAHIKHKPKCTPVWDMSRMFGESSAKCIRRDLRDAGIHQPQEGYHHDFHTLRTTYITMLALSGASMQHAQRLARLSSPEIMMRHYTKLGLNDLQEQVNRIDI